MMNNTQKISWKLPFLLVSYEISTYLSNDMYLPALPDMMKELHLSSTHAQLTITMWFLGLSLSTLLMGIIADSMGRRRTLLLGGVLYVFSSVLCALAYSETSLLVPRILQGMMTASMMVAGYAVIHELYEHKTAIRILSVMSAVSVLAPAFGPLAGAVILLFASWRLIFWCIAVYASITLILLYFYMPESLPTEKRQRFHLGIFINDCKEVITAKNFIVLSMILGLTFLGFLVWITVGPLLVIQQLHFSEIAFGWMQVIVFSAYLYGSHLVNKMIEHHSAKSLINIGITLSSLAGIVIFLASVIFPHYFYLFLITIIFYSFGTAFCFAPLNRSIIETSDAPMGVRVALFTTSLMGFAVIGSAIASIIYNGTTFSLGIIITVSMLIAYALHYFYYK